MMTIQFGSMTIAAVTILLSSLPVAAQTCTPLQAVGTNRTQVQKSVSPPSTGATRSNWNTDFAIPTGLGYRSYAVTVLPRNGGEYRVQAFLKYSNNTADKVFDRTVTLRDGQNLNLSGSPRLNADPYQVNVQVGGVRAVGNTYTVFASGCR
jgi:hypothetical protein